MALGGAARSFGTGELRSPTAPASGVPPTGMVLPAVANLQSDRHAELASITIAASSTAAVRQALTGLGGEARNV